MMLAVTIASALLMLKKKMPSLQGLVEKKKRG
jgi:hypothetical protein